MVFDQNYRALLDQDDFSKADLIRLLKSTQEEQLLLFEKAWETRLNYIGNWVYLRGLIEYSNQCIKDCLYCGIRKSNSEVKRYCQTEEEMLEAARFADSHSYGSVVIQSGERQDRTFTDRIAYLLEKIHKNTGNRLGITLSLGEQSIDTYRKWFSAGAKRYLLRIESSNPQLFEKIHPKDAFHLYQNRIGALQHLKDVGYQVGTGIMIGLPFQTLDDLAEDLLFFKSFDIDMIGMGPYLEHEETPLFDHHSLLLKKERRLELTLLMLAILRIQMKDINIAATTALQTLDPLGRQKALRVGANVIMPNLSPSEYRENYFLYKDKSITKDDATTYHQTLEREIEEAGCKIAYGKHGDPLHYAGRSNKAKS